MKELLEWSAKHQRALPWRIEPREPYRVWVSEIMLQQTRVTTVLRYYERFLDRFPDIHALARADEDDVMKAWEGLGYYRRARLLHQGAKYVAQHGFPKTRDAWLEVPGVGIYTAGAIASLAYSEAVSAIDGNVLRIFSRMTRFEDDISTREARRAAETWVALNQPRRAAGAFNEALMELGATVCTPRAPRCGECPIHAGCKGEAIAARLPVIGGKRPPRDMAVALAVARRGEKLLVEKRTTGLLAGTWGLPWVEGSADELAAHVRTLVGDDAKLGEVIATGEHAFTHRRWTMRAFEVRTRGRGGEWRRASDIALSSAHRKILATITGADAPK